MKKLIIIFPLVLIFIFINTYFKCKNENFKSYNFVVTKTFKTSDRRLDIYDKNELIIFNNFKIYSDYDINIGDSISKPICSDKMFVYEKTDSNVYKLKRTYKYYGFYPISWICNP